MEEKRKPGSSWMDDTDSDDLGATGVFSAVSPEAYKPEAYKPDAYKPSLPEAPPPAPAAAKPPAIVRPPAPPMPAPPMPALRTPVQAAPPLPPAAPAASVQEPVVHKVAVSGPAAGPVNLLELLRSNSPAMETNRAPRVDTNWGMPAAGTASGSASGSASSPAPAPVPAQTPDPAPNQSYPPAANMAPPTAMDGQPAAPSEGFTQLLRALGGEARPTPPAMPAAPAPVPAPAAGYGAGGPGFTALLDNANAWPAANSYPPSPAPPAAPAAGDGGFTALLQHTAAPPPSPPQPRPYSALQPIVPPAPVPPAPVAPVPVPAAPVAPAPVTRYNPPAANDGAGFTQLLQGFQPEALPAAPRKPTVPQARPEAWPQPSAPAAYPSYPAEPSYPSQPSYPAEPAASAPGSFTQLFGSLPPAPAAAPAPERPRIPNEWGNERATDRAGDRPSEMTSEMPAYRPSVSSGSEPSFTQVMAMSESPRPSPARPSETRNPFAGFDPLPQRSPVPSPAPLPSASPIAPERPSQNNLLAGGEGMTQMLRRLEVPPAPAAYPPTQFTPAYVDPPNKPAAPGPNTSFSGLYKSLGGDAEPRAAQSATPPAARNSSFFEASPTPAMPPNPQQPARGEVTTILEMSKLRELQRQGAAAALPGGPQQGGPSTLQPWSPQMPAAPAMPKPALPPLAAPQFAPPQFTPPAVEVKPPAPAAPAAPKGGMQQYIPLFLIAIIFLLVVILITVVFLLKR